MADWIAAYLEAHELGRPEERVALEGSLEVDGEDLAVEVCRTHTGLWLVAAKDSAGVSVDLTEQPWSYEPGRRTDVLNVRSRRFTVSGSARDALRIVLAVGRLRAGIATLPRPVLPSRYIESPDPLEYAALQGIVEPGEVVLAFLKTDGRSPLDSRRLDEKDGTVYFVLTDKRALELVLGTVGDRRTVALAPDSLELRDRRVDFGDVRGVKAKRHDCFLEVLEALGVSSLERVLSVARLNFIGRSGEDVALRAARALLDEATRRGSDLGALGQYLVAAELEEPGPARPSVEVGANTDPAKLCRLWRTWQFSERAGYELLGSLRQKGEHAATFALHRTLREARPEVSPDPLAAGVADVDFAEHALAVGERPLAQSALEERLAKLAPYAPGDVVLEGTAAARAVRTRILELLVDARGDPNRPDLEALSALAKLEPLAQDRMLALAGVAPAALANRARVVSKLLSAGGLNGEEADARSAQTALPKEALESKLPSRISRDREALLGALQVLVAGSKDPELDAVLDYCEPVSPETAPIAARAIDDAARVLGVRNIRGFVSRGNKDVGVRSYEKPSPFLLLGGRHLEANSDAFLTEPELRFALGAEIAHVRFGHVRVSVDDVWEGALDKSRQGLDFVLGVLPMLTGVRMAGRLGKFASQLEPETVRKALRGASLLNDSLQKSRKQQPRTTDPGIAPSNERLIAAHRLTQLTADRAGLLLSGSLGAALRAMFLVRRDYSAAVGEACATDLGTFFEQKLRSRDLGFYDLCIRAGALIAFYLSDDYTELRGLALTPADTD